MGAAGYGKGENMNVSLTRELAAMVREKVRSGMYASASEVIREALRLMQNTDRLQQLSRDELRREIEIGVTGAGRGEVATVETKAIKAKARGRQRTRR